MGGTQRLLVLDQEQAPKGEAFGMRLLRANALNALAAVGARVIHDSGGRMLVVEIPERAEATLGERLPGVRVEALETEPERIGAALDQSERLFLAALKIRTSPAYREAKRLRVPGEAPEEILLRSGSCVREEY
jgi:hypothetical protein